MKRLFQFSARTTRDIGHDVDEEMQHHLDARIDALIARGISRDTALATATAEFGELSRARRELVAIDLDNLHRQHKADFMHSIRQDIRYALRTLRAAPAFTAAVIITLALGIGATVTIFSAVDAILIRPLPFVDPARIVTLSAAAPLGNVSEPELIDYKRELSEVTSLAAYTTADVNLTAGTEPVHITVARVSNGFNAALGTPPARGRWFRADEDLPGAAPVMMLSHALWQDQFGSDRDIVGKQVLVDGAQVQVIGVMPPAFDFPEHDVAAWVPLRLNLAAPWTRNNHYLELVGRLRPGATLDGALAHARTVTQQWVRDYPQFYDKATPPVPAMRPIAESYTSGSRPYLLALLGASACVLLIACTNVANLLLARGEARRREFALRTALGATARRLVTQLLTESVVVSVVGAVAGVALAWFGNRAVLAAAPGSIPRLDEIGLNVGVLAFALVMCVAVAVGIGLLPALRAGRTTPHSALASGGRSAGMSMLRGTRRALIVAEVGLAIVLIGEATLFVKSLRNLQAVDLGFRSEHLLTMDLSPTPRGYNDTTAVQLYRTLRERVGALPGVARVAAMGWTPMAGGNSAWSIAIDGVMAPQISGAPWAAPEQVTPGYFATMGTRMLRGRDFSDADGPRDALVMIVNETMAKRFWPGQNAIGHTVKMYTPKAPLATIVGVVQDTRSGGIQADVPPTMYFPHAQSGTSAYFTPKAMTLAIRSAADPRRLIASVRGAVHEVDRNIAISNVKTMDEVVAGSLAARTFGTTLLTAFAVLALLLAALGIYSVVAYGVSRRTSEIGVRMALGSTRGAVIRMIAGEAVRTALIGAVIGVGVAIGLATAMRSMLVGVAPFDVTSFICVAGGFLALVGVAAAIPAVRASGMSVVAAMRE